jgi:hypothetical protein
MAMNDNGKVTLVEPRATEAPVVKEEPHCEGETDHCFVYEFRKSAFAKQSKPSVNVQKVKHSLHKQPRLKIKLSLVIRKEVRSKKDYQVPRPKG